MNRHAARSRDILACLGDASRFRLALSLLERERCVTELALAVGLSQSCTTRHLQYLEREGLVRGIRQGKRVMFHLRSDQARVRELLAWATSATPGDIARRLSGGDVHTDAGSESAAPPADRPPRRQARPGAAAPPHRAPRRAAADAVPEITSSKGPPAHPAREGQHLSPAEAEPAAGDPNAAGPGARSAEMEDWLL